MSFNFNDEYCKGKIYDILDKKYSCLLMEEFFLASKKSAHEGISVPSSHNWEKVLTDMGMELSPIRFDSKDFISIKHPAPQLGFIIIPVEIAEKILTLGGLP